MIEYLPHTSMESLKTHDSESSIGRRLSRPGWLYPDKPAV